MLSEWKDATSYSRDEKYRTPRTWELKHAGLRLVVTRHRDYEGWIMSTYPVQVFDMDEIGEVTAEKAKAVAIDQLVSRLGSLFHSWHKFQADYLKDSR